MRLTAVFSAALIAVPLLAICCGCPKPPPAANSNTPSTETEPAHAHSHGAGPEGGQLIELGDEQYHIEMLHDDLEGVVTMIVRDASAKAEVPIDAEHLAVNVTIKGDDGQQQTMEIKIPAVGRTAEQPKTARFELADKNLAFHVADNAQASAVVQVTIDGTPFEGHIERPAEGHGHSHSH